MDKQTDIQGPPQTALSRFYGIETLQDLVDDFEAHGTPANKVTLGEGLVFYVEQVPTKERNMNLAKLKAILDRDFGAPFLPEGTVSTKWEGEGAECFLSITIGRRDVSIDSDGNVISSGTLLV